MSATVTSAGWRSPLLAAPIACGCCLLAATAYVTIEDPSNGGLFVSCQFRAATGLWCPGCGLTRAVHHLLRGDIVQALRFNTFVVAVMFAISAAWIGWMFSAAGRPLRLAAKIPVRAQIAAISMLAGYGVVRNLPGVGGLRG